MNIPLGNISGVNIDFEVSIFYNSASAQLAPASSNTAGGYGWKVRDYPKVVHDAAKGYLFLDGLSAYLLVDVDGKGTDYRASGKYFHWKFSKSGSGGTVVWDIYTNNGNKYTLGNTASLGSYTLWNLSTLQDLVWEDKILFTYTNGNMDLDSITNSKGDKLQFIYEDRYNLLTTVEAWIDVTSGNQGINTRKTELLHGFSNGFPQLENISVSMNLNNGGVFEKQSQGMQFTYDSASGVCPYALTSFTNELGGVQQYAYYSGDKITGAAANAINSKPVIRINTTSSPVSYAGGGKITFESGLNVVSAVGVNFSDVLQVNDQISCGGETRQVALIMPGGDQLVVDSPWSTSSKEADYAIIPFFEGLGEITFSNNLTAVSGNGVNFHQQLKAGDAIKCGTDIRTVVSITPSGEQLVVDSPWSSEAIKAQYQVIPDVTAALASAVVDYSLYYDFENLFYDQNQGLIQYNQVSGYPGGMPTTRPDGSHSDPYGHIAYYYFNGTAAASLKKFENHDATLAQNSLLYGMRYLSETFTTDDKKGSEDVVTATFYYALANTSTSGVDYIKLIKRVDSLDGVDQTTDIIYNEEINLPVSYIKNVRNPKQYEGSEFNEDFEESDITYAFELYQELSAYNQLTASGVETVLMRSSADSAFQGSGTVTVVSGLTAVDATGVNFKDEMKIGDQIKCGNEIRTVRFISSDGDQLVIDKAWGIDAKNSSYTIIPTFNGLGGITFLSGQKSVTGVGVNFHNQLDVGDQIICAGSLRTITVINTDGSGLEVDEAWTLSVTNAVYTIRCLFQGAGTATIVNGMPLVSGNGTQFTKQLGTGDQITCAGETRTVISIPPSGNQIIVDSPWGIDANNAPYTVTPKVFHITASKVNEFKDWGGGKWDLNKVMQLRHEVPLEQFHISAPPVLPADLWQQTEEVISRTSGGLPQVSTDIYDIVSSQSFDKEYNTFQIANYSNADIQSNQASYCGFEQYEQYSGNWTLSAGSISTSEALTGSCSYSGQNIQVAASVFSPVSSTGYMVCGYVHLQPGASCTVGFMNNGNWSVKEQSSYDASGPAWVYVQAYLASPSSADIPTITVTDGAVDHIYFTPINATFTANVWDWSNKRITAVLGNNGTVNKMYYDQFGTALAAADTGGTLSEIRIDYNSCGGNYAHTGNTSYDDLFPNCMISISSPTAAQWEDFYFTASTGFPAGNLTNMSIGNHKMLASSGTSSSNPAKAEYATVISADDYGLFTELSIPSASWNDSQWIGLTIGSGTDEVQVLRIGSKLVMKLAGQEIYSVSFANPPSSLKLLVAVLEESHLLVYGNGRLFFEHLFENRVSGAVRLISSCPESYFYNFAYVENPPIESQTYDGFRQQRQAISVISATSTHLTESLYGGKLNILSALTKSTNLDGMGGVSSRSGFAEFDHENMEVSGVVTQNWPAQYNTKPYASSVIYNKSPNLRIASKGTGGDFTAGDQATDFNYSDNSGAHFQFNAEEMNVTTSIGPDGLRVVRYYNRNSILFGRIRIDDTRNITHLTGFEYDDHLRLSATYFPNAYQSGTLNKDIYFQTNGYDFYGNLQSRNDSDSGYNQFRYDSTNRVRLAEDANGRAAATNYLTYVKYDCLGRTIEEGIYTGNPSTVTEADLNNPAWPTSNNQWQIKREYDSDTASSEYGIGRLIKVETPVSSLLYKYDQHGNVIKLTQTINGISKAFLFTYDNAGNVLSITSGTDYDVHYSYDRLDRVSAIGSADNPQLYASYEYENGTLVEKLNNGAITRNMTINAGGMPEKIDDDFFTETLYYGTRHNGQSGYHNGQIASAQYQFKTQHWSAAPADYVYEYTYDKFGRLKEAINSVDANASVGGNGHEVDYDANGNINRIDRGTAAVICSYQSNCNKIENSGSGQSYSHDANGNITSSERLGIKTISYNSFNNLTEQIVKSDASTVNYYYDGDNRRARFLSVSGATQIDRLYFCALGPDPLLSIENGSSITAYIYGPTGLIASSKGGENRFYLKDHRGSTRVVVNADMSVAANFNYMPYGELITNTSQEGDGNTLYRFTGQEWEKETGLYNFKARMYDPYLTRFYAPDPLHQYPTPYIYSENPLSYSDPNGEWFGWDDAIAIGLGAIIGGGLELAKEAVMGEEISWKKVAIHAAIGAAAGELALYTAGGSLAAAATNVGAEMASGAVIGGAIGGVSGAAKHVFSDNTGNSFWKDVGLGAAEGAFDGAAAGLVSAPARAVGSAKAYSWSRPIRGSMVDSTLQIARQSKKIGAISFATANGVTSITNSIINGKSVKDSAIDLVKSIAVGAISGASYNLKAKYIPFYGEQLDEELTGLQLTHLINH
ncbi:MAG: RHS repeat-associated core domain-containing protein [Magnetococcales bacterium]|nr:RHS repeat-associated core domain-containing protein [Magnetococcales bacterium]